MHDAAFWEPGPVLPVEPTLQGRGVGVELVRRAADAAREAGCDWLHVDFEPQLEPFYARCGFSPTSAGLLALQSPEARRTSR